METKTQKRAMTFLFSVILLDTIGFGIIIPVLPKLLLELTGEGIGQVARYGGWLLFVYAAIQFFFAPILGNVSDRFGRRPVLLLSMLLFGFDYLLMGFAPSLFWLFVGRSLAGIVGATFSTANAYITDISSPEERAKNFGIVGAAWGLGFIMGPVLGGLLGAYGPRVPFFVAAGLAFANVIYGYLILPESLKEENKRPFTFKRANPLGAFAQIRKVPTVLGLMGVVFFYQIAHDTNPSIWTYYTIETFQWSETMIGLSLGFVGLTVSIVQAGLIQAAIRRFGELKTVYIGFFFYTLGFLGFAFVTQGWMVFACIVPFSLGGLAMPAIRSLMANRFPDNAQGELQGAISSMLSLTAIIAPIIMTQLFGWATQKGSGIYFPGAPFLLAAVLVVLSASVFAIVMKRGSEAK